MPHVSSCTWAFMVEVRLLLFQILLQLKELTYYVFSQLYSAMLESSETLINESSLTSHSSWESSIHSFSENCGLTFSFLYRLYNTGVHGKCLLLFGWGCDFNKCEVCCGFKQGNSQKKEGRLEVLEMSARVGSFLEDVAMWPCSTQFESTKTPRTSAVKLLYSPLMKREFGDVPRVLCCTNSLHNIHLIIQCVVVLCRS